MLLTTAALCTVAFLAGMVDAVAGGGGLILLPAFLVLQPSVPVPTILGTNKLCSVFGTASAAADYARRRVTIRWNVVLPAALASATMSWFGAHVVSGISKEAIRPAVLTLLIVVAAFTLWRKDFGAMHRPIRSPSAERWLALIGGAALGFYDGFFGPGVGSFIIFFCVGALGYDFLMASAAAKVLNLGSNLSATGYFAATGQVLPKLALPMAAANILGAQTGTRLAVTRGAAFVRPFFLVMVGAGIARLGWDLVK